MKIETLHNNSWLSLRKIIDPLNGVSGYIYSHETRCNGNIVAILPFKNTNNGISIMLRNEITPCWSMESSISSITGGVDMGNTPRKTAMHELKEEAGYIADITEFVSLGTCRGSKSNDTTYHLFAIDVTDKYRTNANGDGSELEKKANCFWANNASGAVDPLVYTLMYKLASYLKYK